MKNKFRLLLTCLGLTMLAVPVVAQGVAAFGVRDYSIPPVGVTDQCPSAGHTCSLAAGSSASSGVIVGTSTTGTNYQIKWANGQFPQALNCVVAPANTAAKSGAPYESAVTYSSNVPTLTVTATTTEASANIAYVCIGQ